MRSELLADTLREADRPGTLAPREWETLLSQARVSRLSARLAVRFHRQGWMAEVPTAPARHLESAWRAADRLRLDVLAETDHLHEALRGLPTPVVLLKGAAYVAANLPPAAGRLFSDLDIMVSRDQLQATEVRLMAAGWIPEKLTPYDDRYYRTWMHELPPLQHVQRKSYLDVHHTIAPPTSRYRIDGAALLSRCVPVDGEPRFLVLAPPDMVLHSAVHLMQEGDFGGGLRDLLDINDLLLHFAAKSPDFWRELVDRAKELKLTTPLFHVLAQLRRLFGTEAPPAQRATIEAMAPPALSRKLMSSLLTIALRPAHVSCDSRFTGTARWLLYIRSHWLRMPWYQIVPHLIRKSVVRALARTEPAAEPLANRPTQDPLP